MDIDSNRRSQAELYGEPLAEVVGAICTSLGINQVSVARVLGVSSPMLSHLVAARRVKVSNPLAHSRLIRLRQLAADVDSGAVSRAAGVSELERIATLQDSWDTSRSAGSWELRLQAAATPVEWAEIIDQLSPSYPRVAELLSEMVAGDQATTTIS